MEEGVLWFALFPPIEHQAAGGPDRIIFLQSVHRLTGLIIYC